MPLRGVSTPVADTDVSRDVLGTARPHVVFWSVDPSRLSVQLRLRSAVHRLLVLLAAVAVLVCGAWDLARTAARGSSSASAVAAGAAAAGPTTGRSGRPVSAERQAPLRALEVRVAALAGVPAPVQAPDAAPPTGPSSGGPRGRFTTRVSEPRDAPPSTTAGLGSGRGPPATAGTDVTLPPRP